MFAKREVETFPGRRGFGRDFVLYPLSFREFIKIFNPNLFEKLEKVEELSTELQVLRLCYWNVFEGGEIPLREPRSLDHVAAFRAVNSRRRS